MNKASQYSNNSSGLLPVWLDGNSAAYQVWKQHYLADFSCNQTDARCFRMLSLDMEAAGNTDSLAAIGNSVHEQGFGLYRFYHKLADTGNDAVEPERVEQTLTDELLVRGIQQLNRHFGLEQFDQGVLSQHAGMSLLEDLKDSPQSRFVPYSNRQMNWHTDGYYNSQSETIRSFTLHCLNPATSGGTLHVMDPQRLLIAMYDEDRRLVDLLSHPQAMMLPANKDELGHDRPDRYAPVVFNATNDTAQKSTLNQSLGLRYTTRTKHIQWRCDETRQAAEHVKVLIDNLLDTHSHVTLQRGEGIITRNVLHKRDSFIDAGQHKRQMLRGRYTQSPLVQTAGSTQTGRQYRGQSSSELLPSRNRPD